MIYEFLCPQCGPELVDRPMSEAGRPHSCTKCGTQARRLFSIKLLGREKPGSFRFDRGKLNAWDDRVATMRNMEEKKGSAYLQRFRSKCGEALYQGSLRHKKANYA